MNIKAPQAVVCGAGGFIGGPLVKNFLKRGIRVIRAVDVKPLEDWYQITDGIENLSLDLKENQNCLIATRDAEHVYQLAADMGGMGFIENNKALCMLNVLMNTNMLIAVQETGAKRFFYASSACVYNAQKQTSADVVPLKESDAYRLFPKMVMAGKNYSANECAVISKRTSA